MIAAIYARKSTEQSGVNEDPPQSSLRGCPWEIRTGPG